MNLLIVDDEVITTQVLKEKLNRKYLGISSIFTAYSVDMAEKILQKENVEIILCDVEMPRANGLELLEWVRNNQKEAEFLFLTSHEKFEYIFSAMQQGASDYLLKPIDISKIEQALFKVTEKVRKQKQLNEVQEYWNYGKRRILKALWRNIIFGEISGQENIFKEIEKQGLERDIGCSYILVLVLFQKENVFRKKEPYGLNQFIIDNVLAEALTEKFEMANCVHWEENDDYYVAVVSEKQKEDVEARMEKVKSVLEYYFDCPVRAVYVSDAGDVSQLGKYREQISVYASSHIHEGGKVFFIHGQEKGQEKMAYRLNTKFVLQCFERGERVKLLEYLQKSILNVQKKDSEKILLEYFQMDLLQISGAYLHQHDINTEFLFTDEGYKKTWLKSHSSTFFMIQWSAYYVNKIFDSIKNGERGNDIVDNMVTYIHKHYEENINRNMLAKKVGFSPEYIGKIFKRKTGMGINEYINTIRIEKARNLLETTDYKIIDIALMVGYDNMPYFSSVFKKYVGVSPAEYKKDNLK